MQLQCTGYSGGNISLFQFQYIIYKYSASEKFENRAYSRTNHLRENIVSLVREQTIIQPLKISEVAKRIENVWRAVQREDFVFVFRNIEEIDVCAEFNQLQSKMKKEASQSISDQESTILTKLLNEVNQKKNVDHTWEDELKKLVDECISSYC